MDCMIIKFQEKVNLSLHFEILGKSFLDPHTSMSVVESKPGESWTELDPPDDSTYSLPIFLSVGKSGPVETI